MMKKIGVILHNLGGPTSLDAIRPFLTNLFLDPEIIKIPLPGLLGRLFPRRLFAEFVARRRTPKVRPNYEAIGGRSPIVERSQEQADALERELNRRFAGAAEFHVKLGMRYWHPFTTEAIDELIGLGVEDIFLLPLYPQYSRTTTGSSFKEWRDLHRKAYGRRFRVKAAKDYYLHPRYIEAINDRIDATIADRFTEDERKNLHFLFSAHGTPVAEVETGDPYSPQIDVTIAAVMAARGNDYPWHQSFQSRVGPVRWLEPYTQDKLAELGKEGVDTLLVIPVAFVTDHIETLHELDIELREVAEHAGIRRYEVMYALNATPLFIAALADVVEERYRPRIGERMVDRRRAALAETRNRRFEEAKKRRAEKAKSGGSEDPKIRATEDPKIRKPEKR
jgi:ferrochelatase